MSTIVSTAFLLPGYVVTNGNTTGNSWTDPDNILLVDNLFAESDPNSGSASDIEIGGFNASLAQNAVIVGIEMELIAKTGALDTPAQTLTIYAVDNTSGSDVLYPYTTPVNSLNTTLQTLLLGTPTYQFATAFTADQINNLKFSLVANGDIYVDSFLMKVYYYIPDPATPPDPSDENCESCNSPIQVQAMYLETPFLYGQTQFFLQAGSLQYPDGTPVQPGDVGECGGSIDFVFDEGKPKGSSNNNFEENVTLNLSTGYWTVLPSGVVKVDIGSTSNRGLQFHTPAGHVDALMSDHDANSKVIISNNCKFYLRYVRACQAGTVFSRPIEVEQNSTLVAKPTEIFNFIGAGVTAVQDGTDPEKVNITIPGSGVKPPNVVSVTSRSSGNVQVTTLDADLDISGLNRGAVVQISTEEAQTVVSVTVGGVVCTQEAVDTDAPNNIRQEIWACVNPPLGTQSVVITLSGAAYLTFGAEALSEIDTSNMIGNTQTATGSGFVPTLALTTANDNSIVIDGLATAQTPIIYTSGAGQALNWAITANGNTRQGGSSVEGAGIAPDSITMSYSITQSTPWVLTAIEINGIPAIAPIVSPLTVQDESGGVVVPNVVKIVVPDTHLNSPVATEADITFQQVDIQVSQTAHGFSQDDIVKSSGTDGEYTLSQADVLANSDVVGVVSIVIDADNFVITTEGHVLLNALPGGAVAGDILYLDDGTPGIFTLTAPTATNSVVKQLGEVINAATGLIYFHNYLGLSQTQINPGTVADYTVNADETVTDWFTNEIQSPFLGGTNETPWTFTGTFSGQTQYGNGAALLSTTQSQEQYAYVTLQGLILGGGGGAQTFGSTLKARLRFIANMTKGVSTDGSGTSYSQFIGYTNGFGGDSLANITSITNKRIGFATYNGLLYIIVCDGAAITATSLGAYNTNILNQYEIVCDGTTDVKFYVNGALVGTITTNIPTSGNTLITGYMKADAIGAVSHGFAFISNLVYSKKLS